MVRIAWLMAAALIFGSFSFGTGAVSLLPGVESSVIVGGSNNTATNEAAALVEDAGGDDDDK